MNGYAIAALLWIASLAGVGYWQNDAGHVAERSVWQDKENIELRLANSHIATLNAAARQTEQRHAAALSSISTDYQKRLSNATKQRAADVAAIRNGSIRLRDTGTSGVNPDCCAMPDTIASASRCYGRAAGELSPASAEFLLSLANDADHVADQLSACQQVVRADRSM